MKTRITLTIDPAVLRHAKRLARARGTNVSALIEGLVRATRLTSAPEQRPFARRWAGKFRVATPTRDDPRLEALKARYDLGSR
jgi:hypothetical protein